MPLNSAEKIMVAKKFLNFSNEDFSWKFDGVSYEFKAGQEIFLEDFKAEHFAKHLIDREINKLGKRTDYAPLRAELLAKCFPTDEVVTPLEALNLNEKAKVVKKKKVEPEFEELKESKKK